MEYRLSAWQLPTVMNEQMIISPLHIDRIGTVTCLKLLLQNVFALSKAPPCDNISHSRLMPTQPKYQIAPHLKLLQFQIEIYSVHSNVSQQNDTIISF
jgi:hypothetical protein